MAKAKKKTHGGKRKGSGRKPIDDSEKKKTYHVYLKEADKDEIVEAHGSLTKAILTTKPKKKLNKLK